MTHHTSFVPFHELHNLGGLLLPQEDVPAVAAAHHKLTLGTVEVDALHWEETRRQLRTGQQSSQPIPAPPQNGTDVTRAVSADAHTEWRCRQRLGTDTEI